MSPATCDIGIIGLGAMGRNLALNLADHEFMVAGHDKSEERVEALQKEAASGRVQSDAALDTFIRRLRRPRTITLLVPAGPTVDSVLDQIRPRLDPGDVVIDAGNSFYKETELRQQRLEADGFHLLGVGISGGAHGARHGPSIMPGGSKAPYDQVRPMFEAIAARAQGQPCVTYLGPRGAGHFVKMVHNGIEYGIMQLIAETYHLLIQALDLDEAALSEVYREWNNGVLNSYLLEITTEIFSRTDDKTGRPLVEMILDVARQKGTGMWTSQCAMDLQVPVPTIDMGVAMRNLSGREDQREEATQALRGPAPHPLRQDKALQENLRNGYLASAILTYAQGFSLLKAASDQYEYDLSLKEIARIWREGCIIRAAVLDDIALAFEKGPELPSLLVDAKHSGLLMACQADLRRVVCTGAELGVPLPAFMASLAYFDALRSRWLPANLIQAQRDYFGAHQYERVDDEQQHHTAWQTA